MHQHQAVVLAGRRGVWKLVSTFQSLLDLAAEGGLEHRKRPGACAGAGVGARPHGWAAQGSAAAGGHLTAQTTLGR